MSDRSAFQDFHATTLARPLAELEARRLSITKFAYAAFAPLGLMAVIFATGVRENGVIAYVLLGLTALGLGGWFYYLQSDFRDDFKREIVTRVIGFFSPGLRYNPKSRISRTQFETGDIFQHRIDRYNGEDHVTGQLGQTAFEFSELHAEYKTTTRTKNGTQTHWHTIFKGLYFIADFNKDFRGDTVVLPDSLQSAFGFLGQKLQSLNFSRGQLIKLEDPEFEKAFVVYSDDQIEARYILTPALMQRMVELKRKVGGRVYFAFTGSKVHVAIPTSKDHFEPRIFSTLLDVSAIEQYYHDLQLISGIIEDLNLNTRIWTKA